MTLRRLVFLDFDGVLHPGLAGTFIYLPDFEAFLAAHPDVGVVFSTSWREQESFESLVEFFSQSLRPRFLGVTPQSAGGPGSRWRECHEWVVEHDFRGPWAALDDDAQLFPSYCSQLVLCASARGLRKAQLDELRVKLQLSA